MTTDFLTGAPRLLMFSGKGGVGKTTLACATALSLARRGQRTILISTDPAHSLGDSLDCLTGDSIVPVPGVDRLSTLEIHAEPLVEDFKNQNRQIISTIADRGTYFDQEDITQFMELSLPGMDEVMALLQISDLLSAGQYDSVVVDTAPTGHTLRLLGLPESILNWLKVLDLMQEKYRFMVRRFTGTYRPDAADDFLSTWQKRVEGLQAVLTNARQTGFVVVTVPEPVILAETIRLCQALKENHIPLLKTIVNQLQPPTGCPLCAARQQQQTAPLVALQRQLAGKLLRVPLFPGDLHGLTGLNRFLPYLTGEEQLSWPTELANANSPSPAGREPAVLASLEFRTDRPDSPGATAVRQLLQQPPTLIIAGGKGGVGKTTVAAAIALALTEQWPQEEILVVSIDPAHSLGDALGHSLGHDRRRVSGHPHLYAQEIDAMLLLEELKDRYCQEIDEVFDGFLGNSGLGLEFDQELLRELITLAPPGLDELMALVQLMDLLEAREYRTVVLDTAPTGHLLRLLELPELAQQWLKAIFRLLLRYRGVVHLDKTAELLLNLAGNLRRVRQALPDPIQTALVAVTIPQEMAIAETRRLLANAGRSQVVYPLLIVNQVLTSPPPACPDCQAYYEAQASHLHLLEQDPLAPLVYLPVYPGS